MSRIENLFIWVIMAAMSMLLYWHSTLIVELQSSKIQCAEPAAWPTASAEPTVGQIVPVEMSATSQALAENAGMRWVCRYRGDGLTLCDMVAETLAPEVNTIGAVVPNDCIQDLLKLLQDPLHDWQWTCPSESGQRLLTCTMKDAP